MDGKQPDQSMEDILASIRRIIASDENAGVPPTSAAPFPPTPPSSSQPHDDVLVLTNLMSTPPAMDKTTKTPVTSVPDPLLSDQVAQATKNAFSSLTQATRNRPEAQVATPTLTVEALLVPLLKPMLKEWLDQNLPTLVERLVSQELKKLVDQAAMK